MGDFALATGLLRGVNVAATLSLFGVLVFGAGVLPAEGRAALSGALRRLVLVSGVAAVAAGLGWLALESFAIAGVADWAAFVKVARATEFGHALLLRIGLLIAAMALRRWMGLAAVFAGGAAALESWIGHAVAAPGAEGWELMGSEALHLLAAGAWLGALLPLAIALRRLPPELAIRTARRFSPVGLAAVLVLAGTAALQASDLIGGLPGLFGTRYGHFALLKLACFVLLVILAGFNRLVWTPAGTVRRLQVSVGAEVVLGLCVVLSAGMMATQVPGVHEQPDWPFAWRPSLVALEDPDLRSEVAHGLLLLGAAGAALVAALVLRRLRWVALAGAAVLVWLAVPHLELLFVEAYPTSFYNSPRGFAATSIADGATLFAANCMTCHGVHGDGDGPAARDNPVPPADLTAAHLWAHGDGELYWWISHGIETPEGAVAMPGFAASLDAGQRWALIDFVRANNAGMAVARGMSPHPVRAPGIAVTCGEGSEETLDQLQGQALRIVAGVAPAPAEGVETIAIVHAGEEAPNARCVASDPTAWAAYAVLAGVAPEALDGSQFLVDPQGWVRAFWRPGDPPGWTRSDELADEVAAICRRPVSDEEGGAHAHHH